jgi:hypothetical protein
MCNFEKINNKYNTEFTNRLYKNRNIFYEIFEACDFDFYKGCGSYLFDGQTYQYCDLMYNKQELLYNAIKDVKNVLEIGTYMGHSLLIMLLSNPNLKITCIDISDKYTSKAVNILNKYFNNAITFIHSDSLIALPKLSNNFDFFHIDGCHTDEIITQEFKHILRLNNSSNNILKIIFDDLGCFNNLYNNIISKYNIINKIIPESSWTNLYLEIQL